MSSTKNRQADLSQLRILLGAESDSEIQAGLISQWREEVASDHGAISARCGTIYLFEVKSRITGPGSGFKKSKIRINMPVYFWAKSSFTDREGYYRPGIVTRWIAREDLPNKFFEPESIWDFLGRAFYLWRMYRLHKRMNPRLRS